MPSTVVDTNKSLYPHGIYILVATYNKPAIEMGGCYLDIREALSEPSESKSGGYLGDEHSSKKE